MNAFTDRNMENAGFSDLGVNSYFPSIPTLQELCSYTIESYANARLGDLISAMFSQDVIVEGNEADNSSGTKTITPYYGLEEGLEQDCVARGNIHREESYFPSIPTLQELCSYTMESYATARLGDVISAMFSQDVIIEDDEADNSSGPSNQPDIPECLNALGQSKPLSRNKKRSAETMNDTEVHEEVFKKRKIVSYCDDEDFPPSPDSGVEISSLCCESDSSNLEEVSDEDDPLYYEDGVFNSDAEIFNRPYAIRFPKLHFFGSTLLP